MEMRTCNKCGEEWPIDCFYLVYFKSRGKSYRRGYCKWCDNAQTREGYRKHKEKRLVAAKDRYEKSPWTARLRALTRRCKIGFISITELKQLVKEAENECYYCGHPLDGKWTIDHSKPIKDGGTNDVDNLRVCCLSCNSKKRVTSERDFLLKIKGVPF